MSIPRSTGPRSASNVIQFRPRTVEATQATRAPDFLGRMELARQHLLAGRNEAAKVEMLRIVWDMTG